MIILRENGDGQHGGSPLGGVLGTGFRADGDSSDGSVGNEKSGGLNKISPGSVSNGNFSGNLGRNPLGRVLGADSGLGT